MNAKIIASVSWILGIASLDVAWILLHTYDTIALVVGILGLLPAWVFFAKEVDVSLLGQKVHITSPDIERATEKVVSAAAKVVGEEQPSLVAQLIKKRAEGKSFDDAALSIEGRGNASGAIAIGKRPSWLWRVATSQSRAIDPNLALVNLRIEIEKGVREIAQRAGVDLKLPLSRMIHELQRKGVFDADFSQGLLTLVRYGNDAAHGADVPREAARKILEAESTVLGALDAVGRKFRDSTP